MKLSEAQRRVLEALSEDEWVWYWTVRDLAWIPVRQGIPTSTLRALERRGLAESRESYRWRRTPAGTAALGGEAVRP